MSHVSSFAFHLCILFILAILSPLSRATGSSHQPNSEGECQRVLKLSHRLRNLAVTALVGTPLFLSGEAHAQRSPWLHPEDYSNIPAPGQTVNPNTRPPALNGSSGLRFNPQVRVDLRVHTIGNQFPVARDVRLGQQEAANLNKPLWNHPQAQAYYDRVGARLVQALGAPARDFQFNFQIIDDKATDAFVFPGGPVFLASGLLPYIENEAQLAGITAHLMAHIVERHITDRYIRQVGIGSLSGAVAGGLTADSGLFKQLLAASASVFANRYAQRKLDQSTEVDADTFAVQLMAAAGYDPQQLALFYQKIQSRWFGKPAFLKTHSNPNHLKTIQGAFVNLPINQSQVTAGPPLQMNQ